LETGYLKDALVYSNRSLDLIEKDGILNPFTVSTRLDNHEANLVLANNIMSLKGSIIEEAAKSHAIGDKYLIAKSYYLLSNCLIKSFDEDAAFHAHRRAYTLYTQNGLIDHSLLFKLFNNTVIDQKTIDKHLADYSKQTTSTKVLLLLRLNKLLLLFQATYSSLKEIDAIIDELITNGVNDILLAKAYFMKFLLLEMSEKDQISDYYLELAYDVLTKGYTADSMIHSDFMLFVTTHSVNKKIKSYKLDKFIANTYDLLFKKGLLYPNYHSLMLNRNMVFKNLNNPQEAIKHYANFHRIHQNYIGKQSETLFILNLFLRYTNLPVYESYI
jgi:hypothetical protein